DAAAIRQGADTIIRVAAPMVIASLLLPALIREYASIDSTLTIRVHDTPVDAVVNAVVTGEAHFGLGPDRPISSEIVIEELFTGPCVLWCAPSHPLASRAHLDWADLRDVPLIATGRDYQRGTSQMLDNVPRGVGVSPIDIVENVTTALGFAAEGLACTLAPF